MKDQVEVHWLDSSIKDSQIDTHELPVPARIISIGWLSKETDDYICLSRDYHPDPDSYDWRGNEAIPKFAVTQINRLVKHSKTNKPSK